MPHVFTGQNVNLCTTGTAGELAELYLDVPLEHKCIYFPFFLGEGAEGNGTGDVRRAVEILCTTVKQQQASGLEWDIGLGCRFVMHDGSMGAVAGDGVEGDVTIERLLSTE